MSDSVARHAAQLLSARLGTITEGARGLARLGARDELRAALRSDNPYVRETAASSLMDIAEPQDVATFVGLLRDRELQIADVAQEFLSGLGPEVAPLVIAHVLDDPGSASLDAIELLGMLDDPHTQGQDH